MTARLPTLNAFRFFDAAARHRSFTRAGDELCVTHSAVSQQIRGLEDALGVALFHRVAGEMQLTLEGTRLLAYVREALGKLQQGVARVSRKSNKSKLTVSVHPAFGSRWLLPKLASFATDCPDIELHIQSSLTVTDFAGIDVAIRFGSGIWGNHQTHLLLDECLLPVCSPAYRERLYASAGEEDLSAAELLHDERFPWALWAATLVDAWTPTTAGLHFNDAGQLIEAAVAGYGVALARASLCGQELAKGRLVRLAAKSIPLETSYYAVVPGGNEANPRTHEFVRWLLRSENLDAGVTGK